MLSNQIKYLNNDIKLLDTHDVHTFCSNRIWCNYLFSWTTAYTQYTENSLNNFFFCKLCVDSNEIGINLYSAVVSICETDLVILYAVTARLSKCEDSANSDFLFVCVFLVNLNSFATELMEIFGHGQTRCRSTCRLFHSIFCR